MHFQTSLGHRHGYDTKQLILLSARSEEQPCGRPLDVKTVCPSARVQRAESKSLAIEQQSRPSATFVLGFATGQPLNVSMEKWI